jgi:hypothetical protein
MEEEGDCIYVAIIKNILEVGITTISSIEEFDISWPSSKFSSQLSIVQ